jgi:hypothetical protein
MNDCDGNFDELVCVDGCIMFMQGKIAKEYKFDFDTLDGYHFYDYDMCFNLLKNGYDVGVIDVLVEHKSIGNLTDDWFRQKENFQNKWNMLKYPVTKEQFVKL